MPQTCTGCIEEQHSQLSTLQNISNGQCIHTSLLPIPRTSYISIWQTSREYFITPTNQQSRHKKLLPITSSLPFPSCWGDASPMTTTVWSTSLWRCPKIYAHGPEAIKVSQALIGVAIWIVPMEWAWRMWHLGGYSENGSVQMAWVNAMQLFNSDLEGSFLDNTSIHKTREKHWIHMTVLVLIINFVSLEKGFESGNTALYEYEVEFDVKYIQYSLKWQCYVHVYEKNAPRVF